MNDLQVLIFGSFTEEESRSMQCKPQKKDVEITFGSFDSETLRSVGIINSRVTSELYSPRRREQSTPAGAANLFRLPSSVKSASDLKVAFVEENGCTTGTCPGESAVKELIPGHIEWPAYVSYDSADNLTEKSAQEQLGIHSELSSSKDAVLESNKSVFKESNGATVIPRNFLPRGLVNLGNLCFLNATLQALLSCSPFSELLNELRNRDIPKVGYPTLSAFVEFISDFDILTDTTCKRNEQNVLESGMPFRPIMFDSILKSFTPDIPDNLSGRPRQEDAQEFLSFVMHQLHDELLKLDAHISNGNGKTASLVSSTDDESEDDNWETVGPRNKTAITRTQSFVPSKLSAIFGGQLKSVVKARGNKASATIQPFLLLHLNICPEPVCTIEDALRLFSAPETLEGYRTSASGKAEVVTASKSVKILELSQIMILHLMRFSYGSQGSTKLHKSVHFPLELFVGREWLASPSSEFHFIFISDLHHRDYVVKCMNTSASVVDGKGVGLGVVIRDDRGNDVIALAKRLDRIYSIEVRKYELVATITHHGRDPSKGHYTADARHPNGKWLRYDDASVTLIPESKVLHDQAYVLFYKQM